MSQPTRSDVHVDVPLTNVSVAYMQNEKNFVARRAFPIVPVSQQSNKYYVFTKNDWMRDQMERRAPGTESAGSGYNLSTDNYSCDVFALHKDIDEQTRANSDSVLGPDRNAAQWLTQMALIKQERQWAADYFVTGVWGTSATPSALWDVYTTSDPFSDVETGKRTILLNTGMEPNTWILGYDVYKALRNHPDVIDRVKYTTGALSVTEDLLARAFDIERVMVCKAVYASNAEAESGVQAFIQGKHALLCYSNPTPALESPSAGYTFVWNGLTGSTEGVRIKNFYIDAIASDRIEIEAAFDNKLVATDMGYFFESAVS